VLHRAVVDFAPQLEDGGVHLDDVEEREVAQAGEDPALRHQDIGLDFGLVLRVIGPGGQDGGPIVPGHLFVGSVDHRIIAAGGGDAGLEVVGDEQLRAAPELLQHVDVRGDPGREALVFRGLGVQVAARPERADEQLDGPRLAGAPVDDLGALAGEVDERLLPGPVHLPHGG